MKISIGSKNRLPVPVFEWMPPDIVRLFVEPCEESDYRASVPEGCEIVVLDQNDGGFGVLLNAMFAEAVRLEEEEVFFFDDDVTALKQRPDLAGKWATVGRGEVEAVLSEFAAKRRARGAAQLALSFSGHSWGASKAYSSPVGSWCAYVTGVEEFSSVGGVPESPPIFSDWILSALLLVAGYKTEKDNLLSFVHKMKGMAGGADFIYSRKSFTRQCAHEAAALINCYGEEFARVIYDERHDQHEVRFNWKKIAGR